ncbi:MAG TPA: vitamin K epoxide reductase family protein [Candidatus Lumbricidophila sp.]|nr:vitamin K epoxide reductase family protein [Candidatus Lumbricidophila sp.]
MSNISSERRPLALPISLLISGALGLLAAWELTLEKFATLADPGHVPSCNLGILIGCSTNLASWQGRVFFGIPNPLIGVACWPVVITIAVLLLANARLARWVWLGLNAGLLFAISWVGWLIFQSIYVLDVLCPWCMLTWAVTIVAFLAVTARNLHEGTFGAAPLRIGAWMSGSLPLLTVACYGLIIVLAQLQINAIPRVIADLQSYFTR